MAARPSWITISALSALSLGAIASGAIGVAQAMPLVNSTTTAEVPPISTTPVGGKEGIGTDGVAQPTVTSSPAPASTPGVDPVSIPSPQPVAPRPAATAGTSVPSPVSVDDDSSGSNSGSGNSGSGSDSDD